MRLEGRTLDHTKFWSTPDELLPINGAAQRQRSSSFRHRVFEATGAVEQHYAVFGADLPISERLFVRGIGRRTLGAEQ